MPRKAYSEQERERVRKHCWPLLCNIAAHGLKHASVETICAEVGISKTFFLLLLSLERSAGAAGVVLPAAKIAGFARTLMSDPKLSWREGLETFLRRCCYNSSGIAVLSAEEEQMVFRRLSPEEYQAFQRSQLILFGELLAVFGIPVATIDPRLFGNLAPAMIMVRKAMPEGLPFSFRKWRMKWCLFRSVRWPMRWSEPGTQSLHTGKIVLKRKRTLRVGLYPTERLQLGQLS